MIKKISTENAPKAIGPYSQAVIANGLIYTSGQIAINPLDNEFLYEDISEQTELICNNLKAIIESGGSSIEKTVKTTIFITNMSNFSEVNTVYEKYFTEKPARSTVAVSSLPKDALVEIEAIVAIDD